MSNVVYSIRCPMCSAKAVAHMRRTGKISTYREIFFKLGAKRIVCEECGFFREVPLDEAGDYALWYAASFKGHRLWARNRAHLDFLISWISGDRSRAAAERSSVEHFPRWMILAKNRAGILKCLERLREKDVSAKLRQTAADRSRQKVKRKTGVANSRGQLLRKSMRMHE